MEVSRYHYTALKEAGTGAGAPPAVCMGVWNADGTRVPPAPSSPVPPPPPAATGELPPAARLCAYGEAFWAGVTRAPWGFTSTSVVLFGHTAGTMLLSAARLLPAAFNSLIQHHRGVVVADTLPSSDAASPAAAALPPLVVYKRHLHAHARLLVLMPESCTQAASLSAPAATPRVGVAVRDAAIVDAARDARFLAALATFFLCSAPVVVRDSVAAADAAATVTAPTSAAEALTTALGSAAVQRLTSAVDVLVAAVMHIRNVGGLDAVSASAPLRSGADVLLPPSPHLMPTLWSLRSTSKPDEVALELLDRSGSRASSGSSPLQPPPPPPIAAAIVDAHFHIIPTAPLPSTGAGHLPSSSTSSSVVGEKRGRSIMEAAPSSAAASASASTAASPAAFGATAGAGSRDAGPRSPKSGRVEGSAGASTLSSPAFASPVDRRNEVRVAIIVPYRGQAQQNRAEQLARFAAYMPPFLSRFTAGAHIFIIEQSEDGFKFNRGKTLNIGFDIASSPEKCAQLGIPITRFNSFCFHDVDLLPGDKLGPWYGKAPLSPLHLGHAWKRYTYGDYVGGIITFNRDDFRKLNGFPCNMWGWGGEDDELSERLKLNSNIRLLPTPPECDGAVEDLEDVLIKERGGVRAGAKLDEGGKSEFRCLWRKELKRYHAVTHHTNGLRTLEYRILGTRALNAHTTVITVDLMGELDAAAEVMQPLNPTLKFSADTVREYVNKLVEADRVAAARRASAPSSAPAAAHAKT